MNIFQTVLLVALGFILVIGVLVFAGILPGFRSQSGSAVSKLEMWGVFPESALNSVVNDINQQNGKTFTLSYKYYPPDQIDAKLIDALAAGGGPDLVILPHELILENEDKLAPIPQQSVSARNYQSSFVDEGSLFAVPNGYAALPLIVDPLVMYVNKDLYTNANLPLFPTNWTSFIQDQPKLTVIGSNNSIIQSAAPLGTFSNNNNAKDIFSLLLLQAGDQIIQMDSNNNLKVLLNAQSNSVGQSPAVAATDFFLQFSDPTKTTYTWNRSLPEAFQAFTNELAANYFGFASELPQIQTTNPHLNFDVTVVPQRDNSNRLTFGRLYGAAVTKKAASNGNALKAVLALAAQGEMKNLAQNLNLPSASRVVLAQAVTDPYLQVFDDSALISHGWYDLAPAESATIFQSMMDAVSSGRLETQSAIATAAGELENLLPH